MYGYAIVIQNGCSQSSRFPTAVQRERSSGNEIIGAVLFDWLKKLDNQQNCLRTSRAGFFVIVANKEEMPHFSKACKLTQRKIGC